MIFWLDCAYVDKKDFEIYGTLVTFDEPFAGRALRLASN